MLNRFSVKGRMYLIIAAIFALFVVMGYFAVHNGQEVRDLALVEVGKVMYGDQKAKVRVASHAMALGVGRALAGKDNDQEKVELIRDMVDQIRFESDESGYFFVYRDTTNIAFPVKKELVGKDLGELKDKNGVQVI